MRNKYPEITALTRETTESVYLTVIGREDTVLLGHAQYGKMKAKLELLKLLVDAEVDANNGRTTAIPVKGYI